ncbi:MAG: hypothetical protein H7A46_17720 [Verrucomicrobiales bacterium]|nr:hypothetical protein [Verrucomicrobiales bacterium]
MNTLMRGLAVGLCPALAGGLSAATQLDPEFDPGTGASGSIEAIAVQSDGRLLVAGMFDEFNGQPHHLITRLNPDGSVDPTWDLASVSLPVNRDPEVVDLLVDGDDNVLLVWQDDWWLRGWRFGRDGLRDTSRESPLPYSSFEIRRGISWGDPSLALTASGDVLVGRNWGETVGTALRGYVAMDKYHPDGTRDSSFSPQWPDLNAWYFGASDEIHNLAVTESGQVLVGGDFQVLGELVRAAYDMLRFNPDGSLDEDGCWTSGFYHVQALIALPGDRAVVWDGRDLKVVQRDGTPVADFTKPKFEGGSPGCLQRLSDDRILLAGGFTNINGIARNKVAALLADGTVDPTFDPGAGPAMQPYRTPQVVTQPDGGVFVAGDFDAFDGFPRAGVARLKPLFPDKPAEVYLDSTVLRTAEADGSLEVQVLRWLDLGSECTVEYRTAPQTAVPGEDYLPLGGTLVFGVGETNKTLIVPILDDWLEEPDETFEVFLIHPAGAILVPGQDRALATIVSDDQAVGFTSETRDVYESGGTFTIRLDHDFAADVVLDDMTAILGRDYLHAESIGPWTLIPIQDNPVSDGDRSFRVSLVNFRRPYVPGEITSQVVTIRDNDTVIRPARGVDARILAVAPDANDGWWAGGEFTVYDGFERPYLAHLQPDLTLDESWSMSRPPDGAVEDIWTVDDGSVYIVGSFRSFGDAFSPGVAKVRPDGELAPGFQPYTTALGETLARQFVEVLPLSDGSLVAENRKSELVHLSADGTLLGILEAATRIARGLTPLRSGGFALNDGKLVVYQEDCHRDPRFPDTTIAGDVLLLAQSDGSLWLPASPYPSRSLQHMSSRGGLLRDLSDIVFEGQDRQFRVRALVRLPEDRFLACLDLSDPEQTGTYQARWIRFLPDGQVDSEFRSWAHSRLLPPPPISHFVVAASARPDREIVVSVTDTGATLMRLNAEGYLINDLQFESIARLPNGEVHLTWKGQPGTTNYWLEVSDNLTEWAELPPPDGWRVEWMNRIDRAAVGKSARFYRLRFW